MLLRLALIVVLQGMFWLPGIACAQEEKGITEVVARIWTDKESRQFSATFKAKLGDVIKVEKYNGETSSFLYDDLIPEDREYVDEVVEKFGSSPGVRTWSDTNRKSFRGSFLSIQKSEIEFLLPDNERRLRIETIFLAEQDIDYILDELNKAIPRRRVNYRYRVWSYRDLNGNDLKSLGRYKALSGEQAVLTQMDGVHMIPLSRLEDQDLDYVMTIDPTSREQASQFREVSRYAGRNNNKKKKASAVGSMGPIWWISLVVVFLLMLGLIALRYVHQSGEPEYGDEF